MSEEASDEDNDTRMPLNTKELTGALQICRGFGFVRKRIMWHSLRL